MDTRHIVAYALLAALLVAPFLIVRFTRRAARRERKAAERPIRITREHESK
jgi:hypothetical protein